MPPDFEDSTARGIADWAGCLITLVGEMLPVIFGVVAVAGLVIRYRWTH